MKITVKGWQRFQHYKHRSPPWIKLHKSLLDNYEWACLHVASKALAPCIWLLASEHAMGEIVISREALAHRLRISVEELDAALSDLERYGFITCTHDASNVLAPCIPDAPTETETEKSKRSVFSKRKILPPGRQVRKKNPAETAYFSRGFSLLGDKAGGMLSKLLSQHGGDYHKAMAMLDLAATKVKPVEYVGALLRGKPADPIWEAGIREDGF